MNVQVIETMSLEQVVRHGAGMCLKEEIITLDQPIDGGKFEELLDEIEANRRDHRVVKGRLVSPTVILLNCTAECHQL